MTTNKSIPPNKQEEKSPFWLIPFLLISCTLFLFVFFYSERSRQDLPPPIPTEQKFEELFNTFRQKAQKSSQALHQKHMELARLLLAKDNSLESKKLTALKDELKAKDEQYQKREEEIKALETFLTSEKTRSEELDKTILALLDSLDAHKSSKELGQEKWLQKVAELEKSLKEKEEAQKQNEQKWLAEIEEAKTHVKEANALQARLLALQEELHEQKSVEKEQETLLYFRRIVADLQEESEREKNKLEKALSALEERHQNSEKEHENEVAILEERFEREKERRENEIAAVLSEQATQNESLSIQLRVLEKELDEALAENQGLEEKLERASHALTRTGEELSSQNTLSEKLQLQLKEAGLSKEELVSKLDEAAQKVSLLEEEIEKRSNQAAALAEHVSKVATLEEEKKELVNAISSLKAREESLLEEIRTEAEIGKTVREELLKLSEGDSDIENESIELLAAKEREEMLAHRLEKILEETSRLESDKREIEKGQALLKEELSKKGSDLAQMDDKVKTLSLIVETLRQELDGKKAILLDSEQKKSFTEFSLKQKIAELEKSIEALQSTSSEPSE